MKKKILFEKIDSSYDFRHATLEHKYSNFIENIKDTQVIITCTDKFEINNDEVAKRKPTSSGRRTRLIFLSNLIIN